MIFPKKLPVILVGYWRAIDYLEARPEIDIARIGIIGYSMWAIGAPYNFTWEIYGHPFMMLNGCSCKYCSVEEALELFNSINISTEELFINDSSHMLPQEYIFKAAEWFKKHL